jgi:hypothetical protein
MAEDATPGGDFDAAADFDVEGHGPFERLQAWISLRQPGRRAIVIRIVVAVAVAWAPLVVLTAIAGKLFGPPSSEPFSHELRLHAALLVALPMFVFSMTPLYLAVRRTALHFVRSGLVAPQDVERYHGELAKVARLRDSSLAQFLVALVVLGFIYGGGRTLTADLPRWAVDEGSGARAVSAAGWWFTFVARPVFAMWLGMSVFRWIVYVVLMARLARLPLRLVPTHPDGCGGLAFVGALPRTFGATICGLASVLAASFAADMLWRGANLDSLSIPVVVFIATIVVLVLGPLALFAPGALAARKQAALEYGALSARHARLFEERWLKGRPPDDELMSAPEISALCDIDAPLSRVIKMRTAPVTRDLLLAIVLPALAPFLPVVLIEVPLAELLKQLGGKLL